MHFAARSNDRAAVFTIFDKFFKYLAFYLKTVYNKLKGNFVK